MKSFEDGVDYEIGEESNEKSEGIEKF